MLTSRRNPFRSRIRSASEVRDAALKAGAEVVSVDLFDTLVFRRVVEPNSVFSLQYLANTEILGRISSADWMQVRKKAEEALAKAAWPGEVQLSDIYDQVAQELKLSPEARGRLLDAELAIEADVIRPYQDLVDVLRELRAAGIAIVVTTDTYLPADFIQKLLSGFLDFEHRLLCSSRTGKTKRSGTAFPYLAAEFPGRKILHFGDNPHSDVVMAGKNRIDAREVRWRRQASLETGELGRYTHALGATRLATPWDGQTDGAALVSPLDQIAWRWSFVLADFLASLRDYADRIDATDIWFLSRDSETMFKSLGDVPAFFGPRNCRYVYGSRACIYPVIARSDPALYQKWRGTAPTERVERDGDIARAYYSSLITPQTSRILIVDIGWKGRLQLLLERIMPPNVDVFGYYFSLEPAAVPAIQTKSATFISWDPSVFNQAMVEALSGYVEASAIGFEEYGDGFKPVFREGAGDRSPVEYCDKLRSFLTTLLQGKMTVSTRSASLLEARKSMIRQISLYPDRTTVAGFAQWTIGTLIDGSDTDNIASGGRATWWQKVAGRSSSGNVWPSAAIWTLTDNVVLGRLLQHAIWMQFAAKYQIESRSYEKRYGSAPPERLARSVR